MPSLLDPLAVGDWRLPNRVVQAPLTRTRASAGRVPNAKMAEYYPQRAAAGLMLSEATSVTPFGGIYIANEGFSFETANQAIAAGEADAVAFGRLFIANPDLPKRFALGARVNTPDPSTFYASGARGYTDYPALDDNVATADEKRLAVA
jgi:2,4-dienoyl-CoA reductase-like NADH-dependent reductase (Old Yellow Enzyme family)